MGLKDKKLGIIGTGKMGAALINGICDSGIINPDNVYASDLYLPALEKMHKDLNVHISTDNDFTITNSDVILLAVKPQIIHDVLRAISNKLGNEKLLISIAAGVTIYDISNHLDKQAKVIRIMPNIAATVAEAASAICPGKNASQDDVNIALEIFSSVGKAIVVRENLMDVVTGLSGSGPAFIFPIIEALADGAVYEGLDRENAITLAAQTVLGAAKMVLASHNHPGELKDMVTSPAGTTIRGLKELEDRGIRAAFMNAVIVSTQRSRELGQ